MMRLYRILERRRGKLVAILAGAIVLGSALPASSGAPAPTFSATGCREMGSFFFLPLADLDPYVPDDFTVATVFPGMGELLVLTATCEQMTADGSRRPVMFSEVGIYVQRADSSPSWHYYGLWHATNHKRVSEALSRLGVKAPYVKDMSFENGSGAFDAESTVPLPKGPYEVQAIVPSSSGMFGARPSTWWYKARGAYLRIVYDISSYSGRSGTGRFKAEAGTALAELLGTTERATPSTILEDYPELTATVTRVKL